MKTILIAGLGNPGKEYARTRHNAGFMFVDFFWEKFHDEFGFSDWEFKKNLNAEISIGKLGDKNEKNKSWNIFAVGKKFQLLGRGKAENEKIGKDGSFVGKIILLKPQTFMNLSGEAVAAAVKYYKVKLEDIVIAHDEIDLPLGEYRFSTGSSSAGHRGVQNIIDMLGTKDFTRLRIGVENRGDSASSAGKIPTEKYVLGKSTVGEMKSLQKILNGSSKEIERLLLSNS